MASKDLKQTGRRQEEEEPEPELEQGQGQEPGLEPGHEHGRKRRSGPIAWLITLAKNSPWMIIAIGLHLILAAVMSLLYVKHELEKSRITDTEIGVGRVKEEAPDIPEVPEEIDRKKIPENVEAELVTKEEVTTFVPTEEATPEDLYEDIGNPTGADDAATDFTGGTSIGVGIGGHAGSGLPSAFVSRKLGKGTGAGRKGRRPPGQTIATEEAVLEGLRWLVRHQNEDGSWGADTLPQRCSGKTPCIPAGTELEPFYNEGLTGLALLAFLGQGLSIDSKIDIVDTAMGKKYKAGKVVQKGIRWLMDRQKEDGSFSATRAFMYNEALASMALTEAYGLSQNRELRRPAQKAVDFLVAAQKLNDKDELWGWRYGSRKELEDQKAAGQIEESTYKEQLHDVDISVTTWVVMALKSAKICGLDVPDEVMQGALSYANYTTGKEGLVGYQNPYQAGDTIRGPGDHFTYHTGTMSALGMLVRTFIVHDLEDPFLELAAKHIVKDLPEVTKDNLSVDYYYWYYATLALNQFDGPDSPRKSAGKYWTPWNKALVDSILALQDKSKDRDVCNRGGWLTDDRWSSHGRALYNTAINVLTLEVYYRYENAFGSSARDPAGGIVVPSVEVKDESGAGKPK
jgi:prenyltransferase/squalene oxidase-like repeat protein